jgi:acylphosphatase
MPQVRAIVKGHVQGVFFRATTRDVARDLGIYGFVRNLEDRSVEVVAEGSREKLDELIRFLHEGPSAARVTSVDVTSDSTVDVPANFEVAPDG